MSAPTRALENPPEPPLPRRRRARRILLALGLALLLLVGSAVTAGAVIMHRFDQAVVRAPLLVPSARVMGPLNFPTVRFFGDRTKINATFPADPLGAWAAANEQRQSKI
jgi:hypothetical protein